MHFISLLLHQYYIVAVLTETCCNIISYENKLGKLSFRVYPPWTNVASKQAKKSQEWQLEYFLDIIPSVNLSNVKRLYEGNAS